MSIPFVEAIRLLFDLDPKIISVIILSLKVSISAVILASLAGLPFAFLLGLYQPPFKSIIISVINAFMGLPPVVVGLFLYILLSRKGPLGFMALLYTPYAMIIAQTIIGIPIIIGLGHAAVAGVDQSVRLAALTLGANRLQFATRVLAEARYGIMASIVAAFGRLTAEVGAILIVGGNIAGSTRVMTTTIALETDKGHFELATALGIVLILITVMINFFLHMIQKKTG